MKLIIYERVRYTGPDFLEGEISFGDMGYVAVDYGNGDFEVEFSNACGITTALVVIAGHHLEPAPTDSFLGSQARFVALVSELDASLPSAFAEKLRDVKYGEWELNFEALLLELLRLDIEVGVSYPTIEALAQEAGLIEEGVLDPSTWARFKERYLKTKGC